MSHRSIHAAHIKVVPDYMYLKVMSTPSSTDALTWKMALMDALVKFGGTFASASPSDIMWIEETSENERNLGIVRCFVEDASVVQAAIGTASRDGHIFKVVERSNFLPMLIN